MSCLISKPGGHRTTLFKIVEKHAEVQGGRGQGDIYSKVILIVSSPPHTVVGLYLTRIYFIRSTLKTVVSPTTNLTFIYLCHVSCRGSARRVATANTTVILTSPAPSTRRTSVVSSMTVGTSSSECTCGSTSCSDWLTHGPLVILCSIGAHIGD